jgi:pyruvate ferredoxin oxidoreductase gamma subunit
MTGNIIQTRIHGRGGQGVVTAAELIALAAFYDGKKTQAFPSFGVERTGAPIMAFARISDKPIKTREQIYHPDFLIIQDATLIDDDEILSGATTQTKLLVNSSKTKEDIFKELKNKKTIRLDNIYTAPATEIALEFIGKNIVNTVILGALAKHSNIFSLNSLKKAVTTKLKSKGEKILHANLAAIDKIYETNQ